MINGQRGSVCRAADSEPGPNWNTRNKLRRVDRCAADDRVDCWATADLTVANHSSVIIFSDR